MTQLDEAIARYHKLLESDACRDLAWVETLEKQIRSRGLSRPSRPVSPVLRPHFLTHRQYQNMVRGAEALACAIDRVEKVALTTPSLLARMEMLPAEKMLASVDPGYPYSAVTSLLDARIHNGTFRVVDYSADSPVGVAFGEALSNLYYDAPPMKEFRRRNPVTRVGGMKPVLESVLKAWKHFGGRHKPQIAILELRQPHQSADSSEYALIAEYFRASGYPTELVGPDQLDYRNGVLRKGAFNIDVLYRRMRVSEFLVRFDLHHPVLRAYGEHAVCVVNSFRSELSEKKAIFDLLTDDSVTANFPAAERKAIRDFVPWTRVVAAAKTTWRDEVVDLPEFILSHREKLVLRPNDDGEDSQSFRGAELDGAGWERALRTAVRGGYVVQEVVEPVVSAFPVHRWGSVEMRDMRVEVQPHMALGRVTGCSTYVSPAEGFSSFSTLAGLAPTFVLESR